MSRERVGEVYAEMAERCRRSMIRMRAARLRRIREAHPATPWLATPKLRGSVRRLRDGKVGAGGNC